MTSEAGASIELLLDDFEEAVKEAAYSDCSPMGDPGNYYKHMERDEARKALLAKIEAADRLVEAVESQAADLGHTDTYLLDCAAAYRNPQPAGGVE